MKRFVFYAYLLLIPALLFGCNGAENPPEEQLPPKPGVETPAEPSAPKDPVVPETPEPPETASGGGVSIELPDGWEAMEESLNPHAVLTLCHQESGRYLIAIAEEKTEPALSLAEYLDLVCADAGGNLKNVRRSAPREIALCGIPAQLALLAGEVGGTAVEYHIAAAENKTGFFQFIGWCAADPAGVRETLFSDLWPNIDLA